MKVAPTAMVGFGNLVPPTRHFTFNIEFGAVFQGSARTKRNLAGNACPSGFSCVNPATDPTVQANIRAEETKINNKLSPYQYYPAIAFGFGYRFSAHWRATRCALPPERQTPGSSSSFQETRSLRKKAKSPKYQPILGAFWGV